MTRAGVDLFASGQDEALVAVILALGELLDVERNASGEVECLHLLASHISSHVPVIREINTLIFDGT